MCFGLRLAQPGSPQPPHAEGCIFLAKAADLRRLRPAFGYSSYSYPRRLPVTNFELSIFVLNWSTVTRRFSVQGGM